MVDPTQNSERVAVFHHGELFCGEHQGIISIHSHDTNNVMQLTLAAAEDLSEMLRWQAQRGREAAAPSGSSADRCSEPDCARDHGPERGHSWRTA